MESNNSDLSENEVIICEKHREKKETGQSGNALLWLEGGSFRCVRMFVLQG